jgi:hypothetical protein
MTPSTLLYYYLFGLGDIFERLRPQLFVVSGDGPDLFPDERQAIITCLRWRSRRLWLDFPGHAHRLPSVSDLDKVAPLGQAPDT